MNKKIIAISLACVATLSACNADTNNQSIDTELAETETTTAQTTAAIPVPESSLPISLEVSVDLDGEKTEISPYIFGINDVKDTSVTATAIRQGGNRYSAYNWENNYSNAGADWRHSSDTYLVMNMPEEMKTIPGAPALNISEKAAALGGAYTVTTIQMIGKVSADGKGPIDENSTPDRWKTVKPFKNSEFTLEPDQTDEYVYIDEYINYLVNTLGDSTTENGINGYNLDNEPSLWSHTHPFAHPEKATYEEMIKLSTEYALAIKSVDPNAEIFGPALYGVGAYNSFNDEDFAKYNGEYENFISYYLDNMKKAEDENGKRLLDVLDVHYYSEAKGDCRVTECNDPTHEKCIQARLNAPRSLSEEGYYEDSWVGEWLKQVLPIIPTIKESIDKYYPGTKMSFTEYYFGGADHISGTIAQAEALGIFAENEVYLATLWPLTESFPYIASGINLYTNYDGNGSSFGDTLIPSETTNAEISSSFASTQDEKITIVVTNKSDEPQNTKIALNSLQNENYKKASVYGVVNGSSEIVYIGAVDDIQNNEFTIELPALSAVQIAIEK